MDELIEFNETCFRSNHQKVNMDDLNEKDDGFVNHIDSVYISQYAIEQLLELLAREDKIKFKDHFSYFD